MNLTLTFNADSITDLVSQLTAALQELDPLAVGANEDREAKAEVEKQANGGKPAKVRKVKAAKEPEPTPETITKTPTTATESVFDPAPTEDAEEELTNITLPDVRGALTEFLKTHTESATQKLLMEHGGASKLSQLDPSKYKAVYHAATTS